MRPCISSMALRCYTSHTTGEFYLCAFNYRFLSLYDFYFDTYHYTCCYTIYSKETSTDHKHKLLSALITTRIISGHVDTNRDGTPTTTSSTTIPESSATATTISCGTLITMLNNFARIIRDVKPRYVSLSYIG